VPKKLKTRRVKKNMKTSRMSFVTSPPRTSGKGADETKRYIEKLLVGSREDRKNRGEGRREPKKSDYYPMVLEKTGEEKPKLRI